MGEAGSGGSVAVDDLILSPGCVLQQGELGRGARGGATEGQCSGAAWSQARPHTLPVPHSSLGLLASDSAPVALPGRARASNCVAEEFSCDDGGCVSAELVCDFAKACADGSDENHCGESQQ